MKKPFLFISIFLWFAASAIAQTRYDALWEKIDKSQQKMYPEQQILACSTILEKAKQEKNYYQIIKSFNYITQTQLLKDWKASYDILSRHNTLRGAFLLGDTLRDERALLFFLNIKYLTALYYRWEMEWPASAFYQQAEQNLMRMFRTGRADKIDFKKYAGLFGFENTPFDEMSYPSQSFWEWYLKMTYISSDFRRPALYRGDRSNEKILEGLLYLHRTDTRNYLNTKTMLVREIYRSRPEEAFAEINQLLDSYPEEKYAKILKRTKVDLLMESSRKVLRDIHSKKETADSLRSLAESYYREAYLLGNDSLKKDLAKQQFVVNTRSMQVRPGADVPVITSYLNLPGFSYKLYRNDRLDESGWKLYKEGKYIKLRKYFAVPADTTITVSVDTCGIYKLVCYGNGIPTEETSSFLFYATDIAAAHRVFNKNHELYIADFKTGKPLDEANVTCMGYAKWDEVDTLSNKTISFNGFTPVSFDNEQPLRFALERGDDRFFIGQTFSMYWYRTPAFNHNGVVLFTDRTLYKPGETIHIKGTYYSESDQSKYYVNEGKTVTLYLRQPDNKIIDSMAATTNAYGSVCGSMVIPEKTPLGRYMICSEGVCRAFDVMEYEKIEYQVLLPRDTVPRKLGDTLVQRIRVVSNTGLPAAGGLVKISAGNRTEAVILDATGSADFLFCPEKGYVQVLAEYRSGSGRIYNNTIVYYVREKKMNHISVRIPEVIVTGNGYSSEISVRDHSGNKIRVPVTCCVFPYERSGKLRNDTLFSGVIKDIKEIDWPVLKGGKYEVRMEAAFGGEHVYHKQDVWIIRPEDKMLPMEKKLFVSRGPDKKEALSFLLGTSLETSYPLVEIIGEVQGKAILFYKEQKVLKKGLYPVEIPWPAGAPDRLNLVVTQIYEGKIESEQIEMERTPDVSELLYMQLSLAKDTLMPGKKGILTVSVKDARGKGVCAEVLLSAFDKTTERFSRQEYNYNPYERKGYRSFFATSASVPGTLRQGSDTIRNNRISKYWVFRGEHSGIFYLKTAYLDPNDVVYVAGYGSALGDYTLAGTSDEVVLNDTGSSRPDSGAEASGWKIQNGEVYNTLPDNRSSPGELLETTRRNLNETAFFLPFIQTDTAGQATVSFAVPDLLGSFKIKAAAHNREMRTGFADSGFVVRKQLMVQPNTPQFLREGDVLHYRTDIHNAAENSVSGNACLYLFNADDRLLASEMVKKQKQPVKALPGQSVTVGWTVIPADTCTYLNMLTAFIREGQREEMIPDDSQYEGIPVYPDKNKLTYSIVRPLTTIGVHKIDYAGLLSLPGVLSSRTSYQIGSPMEMVLADLSGFLNPAEQNSALEIVNVFYANVLAQEIRRIYKIKEDRVATEKGQELLLLLKSLQNADGGFCWFKGMPSSVAVTSYVVEKMGLLRNMRLSAKEDLRMLVEMGQKGQIYLGIKVIQQFEKEKISPSNRWEYLHYLSAASHFFINTGRPPVYDSIMHWGNTHPEQLLVADKVRFCEALWYRYGKETPELRKMLHSLFEYAVQDPELGEYYPNAVLPFRGFLYNELKMHAHILRLYTLLYKEFEKTSPAEEKEALRSHIAALAQWLLLQKKNQEWTEETAIVEVAHALSEAVLLLGWETPGRTKNRAMYEVMQDTGSFLQIRQDKPGILFCSIENTVEQKSAAVSVSGDGLTVEREFYRNGVRVQNTRSVKLRVGDKVTVRYRIDNTQIRSFVRMTAKRAACLSPVSTYSGYRGFFPGFAHYIEVKRGETLFFFETLADGRHVLREEFVVTQSGEFNGSIVEIESLYSGDIRGNTPAVQIISRPAE